MSANSNFQKIIEANTCATELTVVNAEILPLNRTNIILDGNVEQKDVVEPIQGETKDTVTEVQEKNAEPVKEVEVGGIPTSDESLEATIVDNTGLSSSEVKEEIDKSANDVSTVNTLEDEFEVEESDVVTDVVQVEAKDTVTEVQEKNAEPVKEVESDVTSTSVESSEKTIVDNAGVNSNTQKEFDKSVNESNVATDVILGESKDTIDQEEKNAEPVKEVEVGVTLTSDESSEPTIEDNAGLSSSGVKEEVDKSANDVSTVNTLEDEFEEYDVVTDVVQVEAKDTVDQEEKNAEPVKEMESDVTPTSDESSNIIEDNVGVNSNTQEEFDKSFKESNVPTVVVQVEAKDTAVDVKKSLNVLNCVDEDKAYKDVYLNQMESNPFKIPRSQHAEHLSASLDLLFDKEKIGSEQTIIIPVHSYPIKNDNKNKIKIGEDYYYDSTIHELIKSNLCDIPFGFKLFNINEIEGKISMENIFDAKIILNIAGVKRTYRVKFNKHSIQDILREYQIYDVLLSKHPKKIVKKALAKYLAESKDFSLSIIREILESRFFKDEKDRSGFINEVNQSRKALNNIFEKDESLDNPILKEIHEIYAIANINGTPKIVDTTKEGLSIVKLSDLKVLYYNKKIDGKNPIDIWMESEYRREFNEVVFDPSMKNEPSTYNLFKGFKYAPDVLICIAFFLDFIKEIICSNDEDSYNTLTSFMANLVQKPEEKIGTVVVLTSIQGTGKSTFTKVLCELIGKYSFRTDDPGKIFGRFNNQLEHKLLINANEVKLTDKKTFAKLKHLSTEVDTTVEGKGLDVRDAKNYSRVIIETNDDIAILFSQDDRRLLTPLVSELRVGDFEYFEELNSLIKTPGFYESLMHYLMNFDYAPYMHLLRKPPRTEVSLEQIAASLEPIKHWWKENLESGVISNANYLVEWDGKIRISRDDKFVSYKKYCLNSKFTCNYNKVTFGAAFNKFIAPDSLNMNKEVKLPANEDGIRKNADVYASRDTFIEHFEKTSGIKLNAEPGDWIEPVKH